MKRFIVAFLLLASSVSAADFLDGFAEMRSQIKRKHGVAIGVTAGIWADSVQNQFIREGLMLAAQMTKGIDTSIALTTTAFAGTLSLDTMCIGIEAVCFRDDDSIKTLVYAPKETWYSMNVPELVDKEGYEVRPSYYDYSIPANRLYLYPIPIRNDDTIIVDGWKKVPSIQGTATITALPTQYRPIVVDYVAYQVARALQLPTTQLFYNDYIEKLAAAGLRRQVAQGDK